MKTRRMMLSVVWIIVSVLIFVACEEEKPIVNKYPFVGFIRISPQVIHVPGDGGDFEIRLATNVPWKATADQPWVTHPTEGDLTYDPSFIYYDNGYIKIKIDVDENTTFVQDTAHVVVVDDTAYLNTVPYFIEYKYIKCESVSCTIIRGAKTP